MMTRTFLTIAAAALSIGLSGPAMAQSPSSLGKFNDWTVWSYSGTNGKVCYIHAAPEALLPTELRHGEVSFFIRTAPGEGVENEANFVAGYPFKENSSVIVDIDGRKFTMFTQGDSAWLLNDSDEPELLEAMRAGQQMTVSATSRRGNDTTYRYSLSGVTAATDKLTSECR
jgi:hypothetical protein